MEHVRLVIFVPLAVLLHCDVYGRVRLQVSLVEDAIFDPFELLKCLDYGPLLASVNFVRSLLDFLNRLVLVMQFLGFEVSDAGCGAVSEGARIVHYVGRPLLIVLEVLGEVSIKRNELARFVVASKSLVVPHVTEFVRD